ncbi:YIP1 family protein [candidate division KSB1 bacterium]|nr:YIP1 family protein [candidate division KSB1 bacterium]
MSHIAASPTSEDAKKNMNIFDRIWNVFVAPASTFKAVRENPKWVLPFIITLLITAGVMYFLTPVVIDEGRDKMIEQMEKRGVPDDQMERAIEQGTKMQKYTIAPMAAIGGAVVTLIIAAIWLFVSNVLVGGAARYAQLLGVVVYAGFIGILGFLIKLPIMLSQQTMNVHFSLATLMSDASKETFLYKMLANVELFNLWTIAVTSIGIAIIAGVKTKKVWPWVVLINVLYWVIAAAVGGAFGG